MLCTNTLVKHKLHRQQMLYTSEVFTLTHALTYVSCQGKVWLHHAFDTHLIIISPQKHTDTWLVTYNGTGHKRTEHNQADITTATLLPVGCFTGRAVFSDFAASPQHFACGPSQQHSTVITAEILKYFQKRNSSIHFQPLASSSPCNCGCCGALFETRSLFTGPFRIPPGEAGTITEHMPTATSNCSQVGRPFCRQTSSVKASKANSIRNANDTKIL